MLLTTEPDQLSTNQRAAHRGTSVSPPRLVSTLAVGLVTAVTLSACDPPTTPTDHSSVVVTSASPSSGSSAVEIGSLNDAVISEGVGAGAPLEAPSGSLLLPTEDPVVSSPSSIDVYLLSAGASQLVGFEIDSPDPLMTSSMNPSVVPRSMARGRSGAVLSISFANTPVIALVDPTEGRLVARYPLPSIEASGPNASRYPSNMVIAADRLYVGDSSETSSMVHIIALADGASQTIELRDGRDRSVELCTDQADNVYAASGERLVKLNRAGTAIAESRTFDDGISRIDCIPNGEVLIGFSRGTRLQVVDSTLSDAGFIDLGEQGVQGLKFVHSADVALVSTTSGDFLLCPRRGAGCQDIAASIPLDERHPYDGISVAGDHIVASSHVASIVVVLSFQEGSAKYEYSLPIAYPAGLVTM